MISVFLALTVLATLMQTCSAAGTDCKKPPPRIDLLSCCPIPELTTVENREKCKDFLIQPQPSLILMVNEKQSNNSKKLTPTPVDDNNQYHTLHYGPFMHMSCFINCAFNDTGIMVNGKLSETSLSAHLKNILTDMMDLIPILEASFKTCSAKAEKLHEKMQKKIKNKRTTPTTPTTVMKDRMFRPTRCSPVFTHLMACVFMETFLNCPVSMWSKTKQCNDVRNHMLNCKPKQSMEDSASKITEKDMLM